MTAAVVAVVTAAVVAVVPGVNVTLALLVMCLSPHH